MAERHLFVCTNGRSSGKPACGPRGGDALIAAVQRALIVRRAADVLVTPCGCLGPCFDGPNAVVYPEGVWYAGLAAGDAEALVDHLIEGSQVGARLARRPGSPDAAADATPGGDTEAGSEGESEAEPEAEPEPEPEPEPD